MTENKKGKQKTVHSGDQPVQDAHLHHRLLMLQESVQELTAKIDRTNSFRYRFLHSLVQGFGVAVGGTIVAYLIITLLLAALRQVNYIPIINMFFESEYSKVIVERLNTLQTQLE